jgi:hypothetical protein
VNSRLKAAFAALWFSSPLVAFRNWQVWDRLPARLGVHFDLAGRPNIWIPRESGLAWVLLLMAVTLAAATLVRSHLFPPMSSPRAVLGVFYLALGAIYCGEEWILASNLDPNRLHALPIVIGSWVGVSALTLVFLETGPATDFLTGGRPLAEEVHASPLLLFSPGRRDPYPQFSPVLGSGRPNQGLRGGPLESAGRIWHSRGGETARLCLGKSGGAAFTRLRGRSS